jgi:hypothetical protein
MPCQLVDNERLATVRIYSLHHSGHLCRILFPWQHETGSWPSHNDNATRAEATMLYVLRLSTGDAIVAAAENERNARAMASALELEDGEEIVSVRALPKFAARLSPTNSGSLEIHSWDDSTLDDLLAHEYPLLNEALHSANSVRFMPPTASDKPVLDQLKQAYERNTEIIREGLQRERERLAPTPLAEKQRPPRK